MVNMPGNQMVILKQKLKELIIQQILKVDYYQRFHLNHLVIWVKFILNVLVVSLN